MGKLVLAMGSLTSFSLSEIPQKENNQKWSSENAYEMHIFSLNIFLTLGPCRPHLIVVFEED